MPNERLAVGDLDPLDALPAISCKRVGTFVRRLCVLARSPRWQSVSLPPGFRAASVVCLLWPESSSVKLLFIERRSHIEPDRPLLALPGGKLEPGECAQQAALREMHEEVGVAGKETIVIGQLDDVLSTEGFVATPYLLWSPRRPAMVAAPSEVSALCVVDVTELLADRNHWSLTIAHREREWTAHYYRTSHGVLWGMAATVVERLLEVAHGREPVNDAGGHEALTALRSAPAPLVMRALLAVLEARDQPERGAQRLVVE